MGPRESRIAFDVGGVGGGGGADGGARNEVSAVVERRGRVVLRLRGRIGEKVDDAPPMLGQRALNVRGALGLSSQRLVTFRPRERIVEARRASAEVIVERSETAERGEQGRDPLDELGLGAVLGAQLYRVDVGAGFPPREVRRVGLGFVMRGLGARWL